MTRQRAFRQNAPADWTPAIGEFVYIAAWVSKSQGIAQVIGIAGDRIVVGWWHSGNVQRRELVRAELRPYPGRECWYCDGSGYPTDDAECPECDGEGVVFPKPVPIETPKLKVTG